MFKALVYIIRTSQKLYEVREERIIITILLMRKAGKIWIVTSPVSQNILNLGLMT